MPFDPESFVLILAAAVAAPVCAELLRRFRVPAVLFEILLGILIGPAVLGWVEVGQFIDAFANFGLAFLMFFAGYEIDFERMRGAPLRLAGFGWVLSVVLGLSLALPLFLSGFVRSDLLVGIALTTTAIGTLLPMLKDSGLLETRFGTFVFAAGAIGEFGPIVAIALLFSGEQPAREAVLLVAFVVVALVVAGLAAREQPVRAVEAVRRHVDTSSQLPVRISMLLLALMLFLAFELGLDTLLGAFTAGMILRLVLDRNRIEKLQPKLEAVGFGVFIPVFFVVSGVEFDLDALFDDPATLARVPLFLVLFFVVRGAPAFLLYRKQLTGLERTSLALFSATALPLVVAITTIGVDTGHMTTQNATALVAAAMLSVAIFPLVAFALARRAARETRSP